MWSGATTAIPSGWALCNGQNGTPNLLDKFIVGAGSTYSVGATGGSASVTLTTAQMPSHTHTTSGEGTHTHRLYFNPEYTTSNSYSSQESLALCSTSTSGLWLTNMYSDNSSSDYVITDQYTNSSYTGSHVTSGGAHTHTLANTGSGSSHENRPPYYALAYIMKL